MSRFTRLLSNLHRAVFSIDSDAVPAIRISGASWEVADGSLTTTVDGNDTVFTLAGVTIAELAADMIGAGIDVTVLAGDESSRGAMCLLESSGGSDVPVMAHTNLLWDLFRAYDYELVAAELQAQEAIGQMVITDSRGEWLELWGRLFSVDRRSWQTDQQFADYITEEAFRRRCNPRAIELAVREATGIDILIEEPWEEMFRLDNSRLSGHHRSYDGEFIGYHLIRPVSTSVVDWSVILPVIERNRPTGVLVLPPVYRGYREFSSLVEYHSQTWLVDETWITANSTWSLFFSTYASGHERIT